MLSITPSIPKDVKNDLRQGDENKTSLFVASPPEGSGLQSMNAPPLAQTEYGSDPFLVQVED